MPGACGSAWARRSPPRTCPRAGSPASRSSRPRPCTASPRSSCALRPGSSCPTCAPRAPTPPGRPWTSSRSPTTCTSGPARPCQPAGSSAPTPRPGRSWTSSGCSSWCPADGPGCACPTCGAGPTGRPGAPCSTPACRCGGSGCSPPTSRPGRWWKPTRPPVPPRPRARSSRPAPARARTWWRSPTSAASPARTRSGSSRKRGSRSTSRSPASATTSSTRACPAAPKPPAAAPSGCPCRSSEGGGCSRPSGPSSATASTASGPSARTETSTPPAAWRSALSSRFWTARASPSASPRTRTPGVASTRRGTRGAATRTATSRTTEPRSTTSRRGAAPLSSRAVARRSSTIRPRRRVSSSTLSAVGRQLAVSGWRRATSSWARMPASGLRNSWAASATKARWRLPASSSRSSMRLSVTPSRWTSSWAAGRGRRREAPVPVISSAPWRSAPTGRRVEPTVTQVTAASSASSSGTPTSRAVCTMRMLSAMLATDTAAITVTGSPRRRAGQLITRSGASCPSRSPATDRGRRSAASASCSPESSGTAWSLPADAASTRPSPSTTWTSTDPAPATGRGVGSRSEPASAATSCARCLAEASRAASSDRSRLTASSTAPATSPPATTSAASMVSRARRLRRRHQASGVRARAPAGAATGAGPASSATGADQAVPGAAHGLERPPAERRVDLAAQVADVHLDDVGVAVVVGVPDVLEDLLLGHDLVAPAHQVLEQGELPGGEADLGGATAHLAPGRVEAEVAGLEHRRSLRGAPPQQGAEPGHQHDVGERLGEVVVGADVKALGLVVLAVLGAQHEHRHPVAKPPQALADPVAVELGQHDVEHDGVVAALGGQVQPLFAVVGDVDREPLGRADPPGFSGTVVETARLGLPALPAQGRGDASLAGLAAGSHTARVWYAGKQRARVAVSGSLSEADVIRNGRDLWTWESATNSAAHARLTEGEASEGKGGVATLPTTPEEAARQVLGAVTPTTAVRVGRAARVAGRPAYAPVLAPKDARSLVDLVERAVAGQTKVPLRLRVFAKGQESPAFAVGFTEVQFRVPDPSVFRFTPPPGAKVTELGAGAEARARAGAAGPEELARRAGATRPAAGGPAVIGESWTSVVVARGVTAASVTGPARVLLDAAEPVQGAFGRGRLLRSPLVSALLTDNGRLYLGAVTPEALTAAAAQPASAARPLTGHVTAVGTAAQPASAARPLTGHVTAVGTAAQAPASPSARTGRPAPALVTRGLTKRFRGGQVAVDGLDLVVPAGSVFGFLGPNGSGKTTTIRMVLGL